MHHAWTGTAVPIQYQAVSIFMLVHLYLASCINKFSIIMIWIKIHSQKDNSYHWWYGIIQSMCVEMLSPGVSGDCWLWPHLDSSLVQRQKMWDLLWWVMGVLIHHAPATTFNYFLIAMQLFALFHTVWTPVLLNPITNRLATFHHIHPLPSPFHIVSYLFQISSFIIHSFHHALFLLASVSIMLFLNFSFLPFSVSFLHMLITFKNNYRFY